ncbi:MULTISPECIES: ABC transporter substrate-binding protein [unclassified Streptomyces]|uniref:ABC transporter substrate-binding protein n=1 Tax=unclassified Streptomyces TaxID=2593676 RepID=UPI00380A2B63
MRRLSIAAIAAAFLVTATACGGSGSGGGGTGEGASGGTTRVQVGIIPIVDVAPLYLGEKKGFYASRGLDLTMVTAQGGAAIVPAVVGGQFQFGFSNMTTLMIAQVNRVPVTAVANGIATTGEQGADFAGLTVRKGSPITSAKELEGKKVAINTLKNIGDTSVRESVRKAGGDPAEVDFVELPFDQMPAALAGGRVDAALVVEPALATVKSQGGTVIASSYVDVSPDLTVAMYFTSTQYAQRNPETVKKFQEATAESLEYANSHPDEVRRILTTYTKIPESMLPNLVLPRWPARPDRASIETLAKLGEQDGTLSSTPDLDTLLP